MKTLNNIFRKITVAAGVAMVALVGLNSNVATAQYYDDGYNNNGYNNGYGNNGYNNGYGNNGYNNGYGNNGYNDYNGYNSYGNDYMAFYNDLAPYGQWFRDPRYGMVWSPRVGNGFVPYQSNGYWAMTQFGNTWMSNYSWGWAAFHYGRWTYDNMYGWLWMPGNEWGPAWVSWRSGGGYYGWAPLGPNMSISMSFGYNSGFNCWTFVPQNNLYYTGGYGRYHNHGNVYNIYNQTTVINNYDRGTGRNYVLGPSRGDVERAVRRPVNVYNLNDRGSRGNSTVRGNRIDMYRPDVQAAVRNNRNVDTRNVRVINENAANNSNVRNNGGARIVTPNNNNQNSDYRRRENVTTTQPNAGTRQQVSNDRQNMPSRNEVRSGDMNSNGRVRSEVAPSRNNMPETRTSPQRNVEVAPQRNVQAAPQRYEQAAPQRSVQSAPQRTEAPSRQPSSQRSVERSNTSERPSADRSNSGFSRSSGNYKR